MPKTYLVETSGGKKFNVEFEKEPSNEELNRAVDDLSKPGKIPKAPPKWVEPVRTGAEMAGMVFGGAAGTPLGPAGQVVGAGLGYSGMRQAYDRAMELLGIKEPETLAKATIKAATDIPKGAAAEATGQIIPTITSMIGRGLSRPWGAYTGMGEKAIQEAYASGMKPTEKGFMKFMRKKGDIGEVVETAKGGLNKLKDIRSQEYLPELERIGKIKGDLDLKPLYKELDDQMKKFNITEKSKSMGGGFDYTNSILEADLAAQKEFEHIHSMITKRKLGEATIKPRDVDILKRNLSDFYSENDKIRSLTTNLHDKTRSILNNNVPGYEKMTANFAKDTKLINEITKDFSMGNRASNEQGLQKLIRAMKDDNQFRENLLSLISQHAKDPLEPQLAGILARSWIPTSLAGRMGGMYEIIRGTAGLDPHMAIALATSSPRISAEFLHLLGKVGPPFQKTMRYTPQVIQALTKEEKPKEKKSQLNQIIKESSQKIGISP